MKFESERDRGTFLGGVLAASPAVAPLLRQADYIVPIPVHRRRERERGFNQAAVMAAAACSVLNLSPPVSLLMRAEERPSQVGLDAEARRRNARGAFHIDEEISVPKGARVVLIDDVRTTGSTLLAASEAIRVLKPSRIDNVSLAAELSREAERTMFGPTS